jgi:fluoride ion exporter CrcB/FEX
MRLAAFLILVFETKVVISKYSVIMTYGICSISTTFSALQVGDIRENLEFSKNLCMTLKRPSRRRRQAHASLLDAEG